MCGPVSFFFLKATSNVDKKVQKLIVLAGPTAIGKTELSLSLAEEFDCEIISMDSMQIYKYMDIGTAKPTLEERQRVVHHLVDFVDPADEYNVSRFVSDACLAIEEIHSRNKQALLVGGTGLYLKGLLEGLFEIVPVPPDVREIVAEMEKTNGIGFLHEKLKECDPESALRLHVNDSQRIKRALEIFYASGIPWSQHLEEQAQQKKQYQGCFNALKIGLHRDRELLYDRINRRVDIMIESGLLGEVENLLAMGYTPNLNSMQSIGYKHMLNFLDSTWTWEEALRLLARDTRHYAKRQLTWFGRDEEMHWFEPAEKENISQTVKQFLEKNIES